MSVPEWKKEQVEKFKNMMEKPVIGIIDIEGLPSAQFQEIRKDLRKEAEMKVGRKTLIKKAMEETDKEGIEKLEEYLEGPCGVISSEKESFKLYKTLQEKKSKAKAKPGKTIEKEVVVPEGPTNLQPGPVLGNLQKANLPAQIKEDKIVINQDKKVLDPGDEISEEIAIALNTLDMKPLEVGIEVNALLEDNTIFTPEELHIDEEETMEELSLASQRAMNVSMEAGYLNEETVKLMISKGRQKALNLALEADVINEGTVERKIQEASSKAQAISQNVKE